MPASILFAMQRRKRNEPMAVKYWSFAGLMLTDWCNARCASCYLSCRPEAQRWLSVDETLTLWQGLQQTSPHGCRVHLSGGEPFGDWPRLLEIAQRAQAAGLGPLQKVETNGYWARDEATIHERLAALDAAGMEKLSISADPFHQAYVAIDDVRRLARIARETLGEDRVQVRWEDWLDQGQDLRNVDDATRQECVIQWASGGRDRFNGRAGDLLAPHVELQPAAVWDGVCREGVLRSKHVHIEPGGCVFPGTCAGIVLGRALGPGGTSIPEIWQDLADHHADRPIVSTLAEGGPAALLELAKSHGHSPEVGYASKCHLCWSVRSWLVSQGLYLDELGPDWVYQDENAKRRYP